MNIMYQTTCLTPVKKMIKINFGKNYHSSSNESAVCCIVNNIHLANLKKGEHGKYDKWSFASQ